MRRASKPDSAMRRTFTDVVTLCPLATLGRWVDWVTSDRYGLALVTPVTATRNALSPEFNQDETMLGFLVALPSKTHPSGTLASVALARLNVGLYSRFSPPTSAIAASIAVIA
ncbi:hypothetical protein [Pseudomonas phage PARCL1pr]|nr:hypothetical protein [Pseudomonas phage PARCL1pr]